MVRGRLSVACDAWRSHQGHKPSTAIQAEVSGP